MNLLIRNVRLIDGTGADAIPSVNVVVENGVISWIGEGNVTPSAHPHYEDINGEDLTLMPGTFDCHEHFAGDGGQNGVLMMNDDVPEVLLVKAAANARRALMTGQTSARDVGSPYGISITLARQVATGSIPGPRITAAGQWIQAPTTWPYSMVHTIESADQMRQVVTDQIGQGAGLIKVGATGVREDGSDYATLGPEIAKLVVDLAHGVGLKVAAHCTGFAGATEAVEAGIDSIEHCTNIDAATARLMAQKGTVAVPTMSTWDYRLEAAARWNLPKEEIDLAEGRRDASRASFRDMLDAGVKIAAGTDAGGSPVRHGTIVHEMEVMIEAGLTTMQAIESATRIAAEITGTLKDTGTVEVGKLADLILIDGDPLSDIGAMRDVWAVFQGGRRVR
jgi:imidazolonepropionase-like amidohydrolase